jgi:hypothetical protein
MLVENSNPRLLSDNFSIPSSTDPLLDLKQYGSSRSKSAWCRRRSTFLRIDPRCFASWPQRSSCLQHAQALGVRENPAGMISYNYTLDLQGFDSNITCKYDTVSPIRFLAVPNNNRMVSYNATCSDHGLADVWPVTNLPQITTPNGDNTLTSWSCKSVQTGNGPDPTYYIYLRGRGQYHEAAIGNITCALSPIRPAIFPVMYQTSPGIFSSQEPTATFTDTFPTLITHVLEALAGVIQEAQSIQSNFVAESVITFGVKAFRLPPYQRNDQYMRLYEAMTQEMIEYQVCLAN